MFKLSKKGVSMSYKVTDDSGTQMAVLTGCGKGQTGEVEVAGSSLVFTPLGGAWNFQMTNNGELVGTAERAQVGKRFVIEHDGRVIELDCQSVRSKPYDVTWDGQTVGLISLSKFTGRVVTVDLPDAIALEARLFAGWLALRTWNTGAEVKVHSQ